MNFNVNNRAFRIAAPVTSALLTGLTVSYFLPSALEFVSLSPFMLALFLGAHRSNDAAADADVTGVKKKRARRGIMLLPGFLYFYVYYLCVWHWFLEMYPLDFTGISKGGALAVVVVAWLGLPLFQTSAMMWQTPLFLLMTRSRLLSKDGKLRASAPAAYAAVYACFEWVQSWTWAGVPWGRLAIGQAFMTPMISSASLLGPYFVSFLIACVNAYIAFAAYLIIVEGKAIAKRCASVSLAAAALIFAGNYAFGAVHIYIEERRTPENTVRVAALQGNVSSTDKWADESYSNLSWIYSDLAREAADAGAELAVMPESAIPGYADPGTNRHDIRGDLEISAAESDIVLAATAYWESEPDVSRNAVFIVDPEYGAGDTAYYKRHLVPFGEFVPFEDIFRTLVPPLADLGLFDGIITPGDEGTVLDTRYGKLGAMVCFDSVYETCSLDEVRGGAELLTVSTNDSWFDGSAAIMQHTAQSVLRAVECGRYVCRAGNTGFSCVISPAGEIIASMPVEERGIACAEVEMRADRTLYSYVGNAFAYISGIFAVICAAEAASEIYFGKRKNKNTEGEV